MHHRAIVKGTTARHNHAAVVTASTWPHLFKPLLALQCERHAHVPFVKGGVELDALLCICKRLGHLVELQQRC